jgi:plasmid stabilization system protein ParE
VDRLLDWPGSGAELSTPATGRTFRHAKIPRSRYHIIYYIEDDVLMIVAVAHERRKPLYWTDRD